MCCYCVPASELMAILADIVKIIGSAVGQPEQGSQTPGIIAKQ